MHTPDAHHLCPDSRITSTDRHVHISLNGEWHVLSSAVLHGGLVRARHLLNLHVNGDANATPPETALEAYSRGQGWEGTVVGMMTAASMQSLAVHSMEHGDVTVAAVVTSGLSNAKRVGEAAEWPFFEHLHPQPHTINIQVLTTACLTPAAMAESLCMITEAKVAVLQNLNVPSINGPYPATGTGTDSVAVASRAAGHPVRYAGKHVLMGEMLGRTVMSALTRSLHWYRGSETP